MRLSGLFVWALPALLPGVLALPETEAKTTRVPASCHAAVLKTLRREPDAKSFCSSFLHLKSTATSTKDVVTVTTRTTITPTATTITSTITKSIIVTSTAVNTQTTTTTSLAGDAATCAPSAGFLPGSVQPDLQKRTTTKAPYTTPSALSGKPSATISSLCSCLHVDPRSKGKTTVVGASTSTVTKTVTAPGGHTFSTRVTSTSTSTSTVQGPDTTVTATFVQPTPTAFYGVNYYAYKSNFDFTNGSPTINVNQFNSPNYEDAGMVRNVVDVAPGSTAQCTLPGSTKVLDCTQITVVMQGYFFAAQTGLYNLTTGGDTAADVDNYLGLWTKDVAYSSYDDNNADFIAVREDHSTITVGGSATYQLQEGQLMPITLIYINGGYGGSFAFDIIAPDGTTSTDSSMFFVPACSDSDPFSP